MIFFKNKFFQKIFVFKLDNKNDVLFFCCDYVWLKKIEYFDNNGGLIL